MHDQKHTQWSIKNFVAVKGIKIQGGVKVIYLHTQKESEKVKKIKLILFSQIEQASKHVMGWERKGGKEEKHEQNLWYVADSVTAIVIGAGVSKFV